MIDYERKCVILHPPKTGGQALMSALGMPHGSGSGRYFARWRHDTLEEVWGKLHELRDWPVYLLVRNPYARMVSYYHYVVQTPFVRLTPVLRYVRTFASCEQFLEQAQFYSLRTAAEKHQNGALESCAYYATVQGVYQKQVIPIRSENLILEAAHHFGADDVPVINATDHRDWRIYYTWKTRKRVAEYMAEDFRLFGYEEDY